MTIGTRIYTWLNGKLVGTDRFGNRYYVNKGGDSARGRQKRWVVYKGQPEASKVPPEWHAWLHHSTDDLPDQQAIVDHDWQREHLPNLTGTRYAYRPPGHASQGGQRAKATGDYQAWTPE